MTQVHKETLTVIDNALPNRSGLDVEIFGIEGIPDDVTQAHNQRVIQSFAQAEAERRAATGNIGPGGAGANQPKKPKFESPSDLKKRLAEHKAKKAAEEVTGVNSGENTPSGIGHESQSPGLGQSPGAYVSCFLIYLALLEAEKVQKRLALPASLNPKQATELLLIIRATLHFLRATDSSRHLFNSSSPQCPLSNHLSARLDNLNSRITKAFHRPSNSHLQVARAFSPISRTDLLPNSFKMDHLPNFRMGHILNFRTGPRFRAELSRSRMGLQIFKMDHLHSRLPSSRMGLRSNTVQLSLVPLSSSNSSSRRARKPRHSITACLCVLQAISLRRLDCPKDPLSVLLL